MADHPEVAWAIILLGGLVTIMFAATIWSIATLPDKLKRQLSEATASLLTSREKEFSRCRTEERDWMGQRLARFKENNDGDHDSINKEIGDVKERVDKLEERRALIMP